mgnify:CR=1 FL=1
MVFISHIILRSLSAWSSGFSSNVCLSFHFKWSSFGRLSIGMDGGLCAFENDLVGCTISWKHSGSLDGYTWKTNDFFQFQGFWPWWLNANPQECLWRFDGFSYCHHYSPRCLLRPYRKICVSIDVSFEASYPNYS